MRTTPLQNLDRTPAKSGSHTCKIWIALFSNRATDNACVARAHPRPEEGNYLEPMSHYYYYYYNIPTATTPTTVTFATFSTPATTAATATTANTHFRRYSTEGINVSY